MARVKQHPWEQDGGQASISAQRPDKFIEQHAAPLFYRHTHPAMGDDKAFDTEQAFWRRAADVHLASIRLINFRLSDWFPRAPGVYWSRHGMQAREYAWSEEVTNDPELGRIFSPVSKMALIEDGGIGTIRLRPRRIDDTDCWLATAIRGRHCAGGIPLAVPASFLREAKANWGDTVSIRGTVRFLQDAGLDDTAAYVHHTSPIIVFVEQIENLGRREQSKEPITLTPVALFETETINSQIRLRRGKDNLGYTFVHCQANSDTRLDHAAEWLENYARKFGGRIITNFDEHSPILADAPLSYQKLIRKDYDRIIIERLHVNGAKLADRIDYVEEIVTEYNNYGQASAFGENARSDNNSLAQTSLNKSGGFAKLLKKLGTTWRKS